MRQLLVLDDLSKPLGIIATVQVVQPRFVIDALGNLNENGEILRPQIEMPLWTAEVKAVPRRNLAARVLSLVTSMRGAWWNRANSNRLR